MGTPEQLNEEVGVPLHLTCPECDGPVSRMKKPGPADFRCEVGHGFSADALVAGQSRSLERALWIAFRTLKERGLLINDMEAQARANGHETMALTYAQRRAELEEHAASIRRVLSEGWAEDGAVPGVGLGEDPINPESSEAKSPGGADHAGRARQ